MFHSFSPCRGNNNTGSNTNPRARTRGAKQNKSNSPQIPVPITESQQRVHREFTSLSFSLRTGAKTEEQDRMERTAIRDKFLPSSDERTTVRQQRFAWQEHDVQSRMERRPVYCEFITSLLSHRAPSMCNVRTTPEGDSNSRVKNTTGKTQ